MAAEGSEKVKKLTIDRSKWLRGEGANDSYLLRERDGKMCCLGFWCLMHGLTAEDISNHETPADIPNALEVAPFAEPLMMTCCGGHDDRHLVTSDLGEALTVTNDKVGMDDADREAKLIELFRTHLDTEVVFVN